MLTERGTGDCAADRLSVFLVLFSGGGGWKTREVTFSLCGGSIHVFSSNLLRGREGERMRGRDGGEKEEEGKKGRGGRREEGKRGREGEGKKEGRRLGLKV